MKHKHKSVLRAILFSRLSPLTVLIYMILYSNCLRVDAQSSSDDYKVKIIPPSPDAASLGKYGDIPVGYYTGTPDINIPLYTLAGRQLSLPMSLNYHAAGFKVEETASWVGLGWSLNAGGVITRTVRGLKDESEYGYLTITDTQYGQLNNANSNLEQDISDGLRDSEPDVFFFNVNGASGKFFFDHQGNIILENPQHYKLQYSTSGGEIVQWTLTTDDGTVYVFAEVETTNHRAVLPQLGTPDFSNTSWYLTKVIASNGLDEISFEYDPYTQILDFSLSESDFTTYLPSVGDCGGTQFYCSSYGPVISKTATTIHGKRLRRILSANHEAILTAGFSRLDLSGQALTEILIKNRQGDDLKKFVLSYSHFSNGAGRLKLDNVKEIGLYNTVSPIENPPFEFTYNQSANLPDKDSKAQDYWGFYNGKNSNTTLIPDTIFLNNWTNTYQHLNGANRTPDANSTLANLLTQIKYPTGGTTSFDYEANNFSWVGGSMLNERVVNQTLASVDAYVSGQACEEIGSPFLNTSTFQITFSQVVRLNSTIDQCTPALGVLSPYVKLVDGSGNVIRSFTLGKDDATGTYEDYFLLDPGSYTLKANVALYTDRASATVTYMAQTGTTHTLLAGGARIKKITSSPGNGQPDLIKEYFYDDGGNSSGVLVSKLKFTFDQLQEREVTCSLGQPSQYNAIYDCRFFSRSSHTQIPLSTTSGSHVGYYKVTVKTSGNGTEVFVFTSAKDYVDSGNETFPFFAKTSYDWARGKLLTHEIYNENNTLLQRTTNSYNLQNIGSVRGFLFRRLNPLMNNSPIFETKNYDQITALTQLVTSDMLKVEETGNIQETTTYTYDPIKGALPVTTTTVNSKGQTSVTTTKYPFDVATITGLTTNQTSALNQMITQNIVSSPVEVVTTINAQTESKNRNDFVITPINNVEFPTVTSAVLKDAHEIATNGSSYRTAENYSNYDTYGNPQEYKNESAVVNAFLWQSIGKVSAYTENASIVDVAYTGFEINEGTGQWSYTLNAITEGKTGNKSHGLNGFNITRTGLSSSKQYIVSYWAKNGTPSVTNVQSSNDAAQADSDGWKYYEKVVTGTASITISGVGTTYIDEVRMYPVGARMMSYSYEPSIGLVSTCDANNMISYYSYDAHGRLLNVKDHKKNVVKTLKYNYKNQTQPQQ